MRERAHGPVYAAYRAPQRPCRTNKFPRRSLRARGCRRRRNRATGGRRRNRPCTSASGSARRTAPVCHGDRLSRDSGHRPRDPAARAAARRIRGGRSVRSAPGVPARSREPPAQQRRTRRPRAPLLRHPVSAVLHLGSYGRDAHELVFFPEKLIVRGITFEAMSLLTLVAALLLEQWRPLAERRYLYALLARYATFLEGLFNAGETRQGAIAWVIAVLPAVLGAWLVYTAAYGAHPLLARGQRRCALSHDGISSAQPLFHRHSSRPEG